jgi:N-acetylmuramoyl-L-alanine amidase
MKAKQKLTFINPQKLLKLFFCLLFMISQPELIAQTKKYVVVLDAGHGGKDSGNLGNGYFEKNIALKIVLNIGKILKKSPDIKVIYTRQDDTFIELSKRASIANDADADLFVSVHCDSHTSSAYGAATFTLGLHENDRNFEIAKRENDVITLEDNYEERYHGYDPKNPIAVFGILDMQEEYLDQSLELASLIQTNFTQKLQRKNRNVRQAGFLVLRNTAMPSVLVEAGFLTNKKEGAYLNSKKGQQEISLSVADAIVIYINNLKKNRLLETTTVFQDEVLFKTQIASSKSNISTEPYNFKGLRGIQRVKIDSYYKYYYGVSSSYKSGKTSLKEAKKAGYKDAFLVAFKNGERISVKEAIKFVND